MRKLLCTFSLFLVFACSLPTGPEPGLKIVIAGSPARTLVPDIDLNAAVYVVSGSGPKGATFSTTITGNSVTIPSLTSGQWAVAVDGISAAGTFIVHGSGTTKVTGGNNTSTLVVTVLPIAGPGSLSLAVNWTAESVTAPSIQAQLVPSTGGPTNLAFSAPQNGSSSSTDSGIMNGYYTLVIHQGQTTSGTCTFNSVNRPGSLAVNITPSLVDAIAISLGGQQETVETGTEVTLVASVPAGTDNVTCAWYVNGVAVAIGPRYTLNGPANALPTGTYRIDVTAFTGDGIRAGSTTTLLWVS
jgi:hypothetical protein